MLLLASFPAEAKGVTAQEKALGSCLNKKLAPWIGPPPFALEQRLKVASWCDAEIQALAKKTKSDPALVREFAAEKLLQIIRGEYVP